MEREQRECTLGLLPFGGNEKIRDFFDSRGSGQYRQYSYDSGITNAEESGFINAAQIIVLDQPGTRLLTMSIQKYERARGLIDDAGGGDFEGTKPEAFVTKAVGIQGLAFPPSYRLFLLEMGCGDIDELGVYGLINWKQRRSNLPCFGYKANQDESEEIISLRLNPDERQDD
jgi:hypothetical protein